MFYQNTRAANIVKSGIDRTEEERIILFMLETKYLVVENSGLIFHRRKDGSLKIAGCTDKQGYRKMLINGKEYYLHRLIWLYCNGTFPKNETDHIDGNKINNSIENLRDITRSENQKNRKLRHDNKTGVNGVSFDPRKNKFLSIISLEGKNVYLGTFETLEEASNARELANLQLGYICR